MRRVSWSRSLATVIGAVGMCVLMWAASASGEDEPAAIAAALEFDGARSALVHSRLIGPDTHEYTFDARKGQRVALALISDWSQLIAIDLLPPGVDTPVYTNFIDGSTKWQGVAPGNGTYTVRLSFLRSASRRSALVDYDLEVKLGLDKREEAVSGWRLAVSQE